METFDRDTSRRVWERVQSREAPESGLPLSKWIAQELTDAAALEGLSRSRRGQEAALLQAAAKECRSAAACLRGMELLRTDTLPDAKALPLSSEGARGLLRRCCANGLRRGTEYDRRADHPEYGPIFRLLARQKWEQCRKLMQLLGSP